MLKFRWAKFKEASAITSQFILVNSISGIGGILYVGYHIPLSTFQWILIAVVAAFIGSYWRKQESTGIFIKKLLGGMLLIAAIKLIVL